MRSGSSHVQVLTASPAACARRSARRRRSDPRVQRGVPGGRGAARRHVVDSSRRATPCGCSAGRPGNGRRSRCGTTRSATASAAAPREHGAHPVGERIGRVEVGIGRIVLDLDVDAHPGAGVERRVETRDVSGSSRAGVSRIARPSARRASWCTTSRPSAVRRTSSSTPSAPSSRRSAKAASVFSRAAAEAPRWAMIEVTTAMLPDR